MREIKQLAGEFPAIGLTFDINPKNAEWRNESGRAGEQ
jgi:hypothetical protein